MKVDQELIQRVNADLLVLIKQLGYETGRFEFDVNAKRQDVKPVFHHVVREDGRVIDIREAV